MATIALTIELGTDAVPLQGRVRAPDGSERSFAGYVGLIAAIDGIVASVRKDQRPMTSQMGSR